MTIPLEIPLEGVFIVLVTDTSFGGLSGEAHSLQNFESSGFFVLHLGHCVAIVPFFAEDSI
jgi:hypothetical protein